LHPKATPHAHLIVQNKQGLATHKKLKNVEKKSFVSKKNVRKILINFL